MNDPVSVSFTAEVFCNSCFALNSIMCLDGIENLGNRVECPQCGNKDADILRPRWLTQEEIRHHRRERALENSDETYD